MKVRTVTLQVGVSPSDETCLKIIAGGYGMSLRAYCGAVLAAHLQELEKHDPLLKDKPAAPAVSVRGFRSA